MGGSKASSTSEVGNGLPRCGCNETMKLLVSKSIENPGRKFWKCRNNMNGCGLFLWDDLVSEFAVKETNPSGCRQCEVNKAYLIEFAKEIVKEIDCRVGKLNKLEKLKKKIAMEKRKNLWYDDLGHAAGLAASRPWLAGRFISQAWCLHDCRSNYMPSKLDLLYAAEFMVLL
ncbi:hypothetical protein KIW84_044583 [Lathyrus oleraceus]|uniref:GRF-type domain-containing protein n=1 Tax=Pisum sativum TaxID=3888 RepID=A0A9D4XGW9_PEA|nr:hypothetical protein KIW84_044583 [Pisum sativum]